MKEKLRNILIKILIRLVDVPTSQADDKVVQLWLGESWQNPGCRKFLANRVQTIKDALAGGVGMTELPRDGYVRQIGQRMEVLFFSQKCKFASDRLLKEQREKLEKSNKK